MHKYLEGLGLFVYSMNAKHCCHTHIVKFRYKAYLTIIELAYVCMGLC